MKPINERFGILSSKLIALPLPLVDSSCPLIRARGITFPGNLFSPSFNLLARARARNKSSPSLDENNCAGAI